MVETTPKEEVEIQDVFFRYTLDSIGVIAFGKVSSYKIFSNIVERTLAAFVHLSLLPQPLIMPRPLLTELLATLC